MNLTPPVSHHFPANIRDALVQAARTPVDGADPYARERAVDQAIRKVRRDHPDLFRRGIADQAEAE